MEIEKESFMEIIVPEQVMALSDLYLQRTSFFCKKSDHNHKNMPKYWIFGTGIAQYLKSGIIHPISKVSMY
jgi:hypothetical protein